MTTGPAALSEDDPIDGLPDVRVGDFWRWAYSDLISNANRGVFAEFIVGAALGVIGGARVEWDAVDLHYRGVGIEVKASGACQTWEQKKPSAIRFGIAPTRGWVAATNTYLEAPKRSAVVYVFCHHAESDKAKVSVLDLSQWDFYVVPTSVLDRRFTEAKTISLARLHAIASPIGVSGIRAA